MEVVIIVIGLIMGFLIGDGYFPPKPKEAIEAFSKGPICVEAKVGLDTVKKCYRIEEVK